jgi:hypothetical protein
LRNRWKTIVIAVTVAAIGLSLVAVAYGATKTTRAGKSRGACATLMTNPQAVKDMQALRAEHQKDMQAWWDKYGSDPNSAEAQAAMKALRTEHWNDMKALFAKYGVALPANAGPGTCGGGGNGMMGGGGCGGAAGGAGCAGPGTGGSNTGAGYGMMGGGTGMMGGTTY